MVTIEIAGLTPGLHELTVEADAEAADLDPEKFRNVIVDARLDVSERRILVLLDARATATLECDRTLRLFDQVVEGSYSLLFASAEFLNADEEAFDEVRTLDPADQELDVTDVVRDTILLAVPARCIAPGAEEEEIPTAFGIPDDAEERDVDPRWEVLKKLKAQSDRGSGS